MTEFEINQPDVPLRQNEEALATNDFVLDGIFPNTIVVKFFDDAPVPSIIGAEREISEPSWQNFLAETNIPDFTLRPALEEEDLAIAEELVNLAQERDPDYQPTDFSKYFQFFVPDDLSNDEMQTIVSELRDLEYVQMAYIKSQPVSPPCNRLQQPLLAGLDAEHTQQSYLDEVEMDCAWHWTGGDGNNIRIIDIEQGWRMNDNGTYVEHQDLLANTIRLLNDPIEVQVPGEPEPQRLSMYFRGHGTRTLGVIAAIGDNAVGCTGMVPNISADVMSIFHLDTVTGNSDRNRIRSLLYTIRELVNTGEIGHIILIEDQVQPNQLILPAETQLGVFDMTRLATALGMVVVAAAGNGGTELTAAAYDELLGDPNDHPEDSGAIIVGACIATQNMLLSNMRLPQSNYGSRVNCFARGAFAQTLGNDPSGDANENVGYAQYTSLYNGTSSAAAIIAGVAGAVQGIARECRSNGVFNGYQLREILSDPNLGVDRLGIGIGTMPELCNLVGQLINLNTIADVYIRDNVDDDGTQPHLGSLASSPDVWVERNGDPQTRGSRVVAGDDHEVYVSVRNRGGVEINDVTATVFYLNSSTILLPDEWIEIGSVNIPTVPSGSVEVISSPIPWPASNLPAPGHYCFVVLLDAEDDPQPFPPVSFPNPADYRNYIRNNNNVAWRNFNIIDTDAESTDNLTIDAKGVTEGLNEYRLEIISELPDGATLWLDVPEDFLEYFPHDPDIVEFGMGDGLEHFAGASVARIELPIHEIVQSSPIKLVISDRIPMRFDVQFPNQLQQPYELTIRQSFAGEEIGRITWQFK